MTTISAQKKSSKFKSIITSIYNQNIVPLPESSKSSTEHLSEPYATNTVSSLKKSCSVNTYK